MIDDLDEVKALLTLELEVREIGSRLLNVLVHRQHDVAPGQRREAGACRAALAAAHALEVALHDAATEARTTYGEG